MAEKDAEITALRDSLAKQEERCYRWTRQQERMLQMEMALAEVLRKQSSENQVGFAETESILCHTEPWLVRGFYYLFREIHRKHMKTILSLSIATLLSVSITSMAATVEYQHPDLTIVAKDEPLDSVLKSLGKEMRIYITVPTGLNPIVSCDIQQQPIKQAFKNLLGDMSYSLEWEEKTGQLAGLTILAGGEG